jgi:hypothetical protein
MNLFRSKLMNRIALWKTIGLIFWLIAFFIVPIILIEATTILRVALLFWYITLWAIIWVFGIWTKHPLCKLSIPYWFRWILIWAWMNFLLALFMYDHLALLMNITITEWWFPIWIVVKWAVFWLIVDLITTKYIWEGKELMK